MKLFLLLSIIFLSSCALFKGKNTIHMEGKIEVHSPYCGGARPTEEMAKGTLKPYANTVFYVKSVANNSKKKKTVARITTDQNGQFKLALPKSGTYYFMHEDKTMPLADFIKKYNTPSEHITYIGDEKAKEAYERADLQVEVLGTEKISLQMKAKCFVGLNPLLKYTGPAPQ